MLLRPRLDLSGTPGLRPIGLRQGSWQTSLSLGSMSRYSAQILTCISKVCPRYVLASVYCPRVDIKPQDEEFEISKLSGLADVINILAVFHNAISLNWLQRNTMYLVTDWQLFRTRTTQWFVLLFVFFHEVFKIQMWLNWFQHYTPYAVMKLAGFDEINFSVSVIQFRNDYITMIYHVSYHRLGLCAFDIPCIHDAGFSSISYFINEIFIWVKTSIHRIQGMSTKCVSVCLLPSGGYKTSWWRDIRSQNCQVKLMW